MSAAWARLAALFILGVVVFPAASANPSAPATYPEIRTDSRYELFAMVQLLAGADQRFAGFHRHDIPYDRAAEERFKPFARHPVVERYAELTGKGFTYIDAYQFLFALGDLPELDLREPLPDPLLERMGGRQGAEEFRLLLKDFARVSRFLEFYVGSASVRARLVADVEKQARSSDFLAKLEDYTGGTVKTRYSVIISPFAEPVLAVSIVRPDPDGVPHVTSVYGPEEYQGRFQFRLPTRFSQMQREILLNDLLARGEPFRSALEKSSVLFEPIGDGCAASWYECAQRHIAFAVAARLLYRTGNHEMAEEWPIKYARIGLPYLGPLMAALQDYERHRDRYPSLLDFFPRLVEVFDGLASGVKKHPPFLGDIAKAMADSGPAVLILPSNPAEALRVRADELRVRRWPRAELMTDTQALSADLTGKILIVVGTLDGNSWLARRFADLQLPAHLAADGITFNARPGDKDGLRIAGRLGFVTTALNPADPTRPVVLYTAADAQALMETLGGEDWHADFAVLNGEKAVKIGTYEKTRVPWRLK